MDNDRRKAVEASMKKYSERQLKKDMPSREPKKKNKKPEKIVEKDVMRWLKAHGFFCHVVDSAAVISEVTGDYLRGQATPGFPDICGCAPDGTAVFIELKAPGKKSNLSFKQFTFLKRAIGYGAFSCVTDSTDDLQFKWSAWMDGDDLLQYLPKKKFAELDDGPLF